MINLKRIYDKPDQTDGFRVLVDRLWPRGVSKEKARLDLWMKEIAPSNELRTWFGHDPDKWPEFQKKYRAELAGKKPLLQELQKYQKGNGEITLLFGAKDISHNEAVVIKAVLEKLHA